jgi:hypothetical protein
MPLSSHTRPQALSLAVFLFLCCWKQDRRLWPAVFLSLFAWKEVRRMVFHFLFFTVKIERKKPSAKQRAAEYQRARYLQERAEAQALEAARYPEFLTRV